MLSKERRLTDKRNARQGKVKKRSDSLYFSHHSPSLSLSSTGTIAHPFPSAPYSTEVDRRALSSTLYFRDTARKRKHRKSKPGHIVQRTLPSNQDTKDIETHTHYESPLSTGRGRCLLWGDRITRQERQLKSSLTLYYFNSSYSHPVCITVSSTTTSGL